MLETALNLPSPLSPLRPRTVHMMLVLAYCAGLRLGEIVRLNVSDFDVDNGTIEIRLSKFFKSKLCRSRRALWRHCDRTFMSAIRRGTY